MPPPSALPLRTGAHAPTKTQDPTSSQMDGGEEIQGQARQG